MIKYFFFAFLFFLSSGKLLGQQMKVGPIVGGNLSRAFYDDKKFYDTFKSTIDYGYQGGLVINFKVTNRFSWETELLFTHKRKNIKLKSDPDDVAIRESQYFVEVPLLLRTSFSKGLFDYSFNVGPRIGYWLGGGGTIYSPEFDESEVLNQDDYVIRFGPEGPNNNAYYFQNPNRLQLGLDVGLGINFPIKANEMMVDIRYTFGHTNAGKIENSYIDNLKLFIDNNHYAIHMVTISTAFLFEFDLFEIRTKGQSTGS